MPVDDGADPMVLVWILLALGSVLGAMLLYGQARRREVARALAALSDGNASSASLLASRTARLIAWLIDVAIALLVAAPFWLGALSSPLFGIGFIGALLGLAYVQLSKTARRGQTPGKMTM